MSLYQPPFLSIEDATVKHMGKIIFQDLDFEMLEGQNWAVLAGSGTEKTAFLDTLLGKTSLFEGRIVRGFAAAYQSKKSSEGKINSFRDLVAAVSQRYEFRNKSNMQDFYYQQRFNASEAEEAPTVEEYLQSTEAKVVGHWDLFKVLELLHLTPLKDKSLIKLSNGETRRLAIAGALMKNPRLLLMDRPMTGLDANTRGEFGDMVKAITDSGVQVVMTTGPHEIPDAITHVGILEKGNFAKVVKRGDFHPLHSAESKGSPYSFQQLMKLIQRKDLTRFEELITMKDVHIQYGDKVILDQVNWKVKQGELWVLKGHNGAGKSTLLSLIFGENPQAYANDIILFDRKRGTGESIWDIKRATGFVSPEMHRYFPKNQTCLQVVLSGFFDTMGLFSKPNASQETLAYQWLKALGIDHIAALRLTQTSLENQRFCLLARAMIKSPALLILDEAAQGMDEEQRVLFRETIDVICRNSGVSLIYVSHYEEDIPACVSRRIELEDGKIVEMR
jgi:molybdate transport system ATP-binding protein